MNSIIQDWAAELGLRHQGVLVSAVRGCDSIPREDPSKWLVRFYRSCLLKAHCGDPSKASSYMVWPKSPGEAYDRRALFFNQGLDHYPMHWLTHFIFAAEVMGYHLQDPDWVRLFWNNTYVRLVEKLHFHPETKAELDLRLNRDEDAFRQLQQEPRHYSMEHAPGESSFAEDRVGTFNEFLKGM